MTNRSIWLAENARLTVSIPAGAQLLNDGWWVTVPEFTAQLGDFYGGTNFTLQLRSPTPGAFNFTGSAESALRDPAASDNSFSLATVVAPAPMLLIDDIVIRENGGGITAWLSSPALAAIDVPFTASPLTAQANDLAAVSGNFRFSAGAVSATASIIANDNVPELTETIRVSFPQAAVTPVRNEITIAIVNDDLPRVSTTIPSTTEGNLGEKSVTMTFTLTPAAPFACEVEYETLPGTAAAGEDYIAQSGRVRFAPGETSKTVALRILGDTQFEADETFIITLRNPDNLAIQNPTVTATIRNDDSPPAFNLRVARLTDTTLILEFDALPNVAHQLLSRSDAATGIWTSVPIAPAINGPIGTFTIPRPAANATTFYQIRATTN